MTEKETRVASFGYLDHYQVTAESTYEHRFIHVQGVPSVICRPASEDNAPYWQARLQRISLIQAQAQAAAFDGDSDESSLAAKRKFDELDREADRELFPRFVIVKFGQCPLLDLGKPERCEDTQENREAFIRQLPAWLFDPLRNRCMGYSAFVTLPKGAKALAEK